MNINSSQQALELFHPFKISQWVIDMLFWIFQFAFHLFIQYCRVVHAFNTIVAEAKEKARQRQEARHYYHGRKGGYHQQYNRQGGFSYTQRNQEQHYDKGKSDRYQFQFREDGGIPFSKKAYYYKYCYGRKNVNVYPSCSTSHVRGGGEGGLPIRRNTTCRTQYKQEGGRKQAVK